MERQNDEKGEGWNIEPRNSNLLSIDEYFWMARTLVGIYLTILLVLVLLFAKNHHRQRLFCEFTIWQKK